MNSVRRLDAPVLPFIVLVLITTLVMGCKTSNLTIDQVKLKASEIGPGWSLQKEIAVSTENAAPGSVVKELYRAGAVRILDQYFVNGSSELQVNYVQMDDTKGAVEAARLLRSVAGGVNTIEARQNIAFEIIGSPANRAVAAKALQI
jgi:hypothetical protein